MEFNKNFKDYIEIVDSNEDLTIQCATIQSIFESSSSPSKNNEEKIKFSANDSNNNHLFEDELRRYRGTIIENKTNKIVKEGSFFPYEFTTSEKEKCIEKMENLNHKLEDMKIEYSYEGTIIRIFYYKKWYISTHRKLNAERSKWGSQTSFKFLFEEGLKKDYNLTIKDLLLKLNLRCSYTFIIMANSNTRFVCIPNHSKHVYFINSNDEDFNHTTEINRLLKPQVTVNTIDNIFSIVNGLSHLDYQGLLLIHKNGSQYRIISDKYARLFKVRNNEQSIPYRYLQLKNQNDHESIQLLKTLFPEYINTFESYDKLVLKLADIIYNEYNKRKERSLLPNDLTTVQHIDQKLYLFIKNKLLSIQNNILITPEKILELLWSEEPSNLNHMIRMVRYNQQKEERKLIINLEKVTLDSPPINAPKKKKIKYTKVPIEFSCRKKLF